MGSSEETAQPDGNSWLFEPAVGNESAAWVHGVHPWRVASQVYVAFFGGVVAITAIAFANARRLGMSVRDQRIILAIGVVGLALTGVLAVVIDPGFGEGTRETRYVRYAGRALALVMYFVFARMQRSMDRVFALQSGDYASLVRQGLAAVIGGGVLQTVFILIVLKLA